ncbi:DUF2141 domain-containing protein [Poritiphilus flavus]|uniref:DUF2141 domain-containing protein n=1 Tax=Poritiphilus flavus TaxID=2697053 RepID=A0A6L9EAJ3_9FLAO|nr:DUF2141 domain-containing protein [Poritiphilus flavus]NAS11578.1 DUF2141 domain-containing protein [Poritiphilus flavus]
MKTLAVILSVFLSSIVLKAQEAEGVTVKVTIENVLSDEGHILASLHSSETFMKGPGLVSLKEKSKAGELSMTFENVKPGTYAIMVMQDANDNQRMDFQDNGMPKESFGMSGNEMAMGPPNFESAKFEVNGEDLEFRIRF